MKAQPPMTLGYRHLTLANTKMFEMQRIGKALTS